MAMVTTTTTKGNILGGLGQGIMQASSLLANMSLRREELGIRRQEAESRMQMMDSRAKNEELKLSMSSFVGLADMERRIINSQDKKAAIDLAYPQVEKMYSNQGMQPPSRQDYAKLVMAKGEEQQDLNRQITEGYGLLNSFMDLSDDQFKSKSGQLIGALESRANSAITPDERKMNNNALKFAQEFVTQATDKRTQQSNKLRELSQKDRDLDIKESNTKGGPGGGPTGAQSKYDAVSFSVADAKSQFNRGRDNLDKAIDKAPMFNKFLKGFVDSGLTPEFIVNNKLTRAQVPGIAEFSAALEMVSVQTSRLNDSGNIPDDMINRYKTLVIPNLSTSREAANATFDYLQDLTDANARIAAGENKDKVVREMEEREKAVFKAIGVKMPKESASDALNEGRSKYMNMSKGLGY